MDVDEEMTFNDFSKQDQHNYIYDTWTLGEKPPAHFNAVSIALNAEMKADLQWKEEVKAAEEYVNGGYKLFWELDLGLFSRLPMPLTNQSQFLSLGLSIEHFKEEIWKRFGENSIGVCLYRGNADFSHSFPWDDEQITHFQLWLKDHFIDPRQFTEETGLSIVKFGDVQPAKLNQKNSYLASLYCRDAASAYLLDLCKYLSDTIAPYLLLDATSIDSPLLQAQLLNKERYDYIELAVRGCDWPISSIVWGEGQATCGYIGKKFPPRCIPFEPTIGICLPPVSNISLNKCAGLESAISLLLHNKVPFKTIPEGLLVTEWDGLDTVFYTPSCLSPLGKRQLQGFCAAGGTVVTFGDKMGFVHEISYSDWLNKLS